MQQLVKISEFAHLSGIKRKNLIYYDEIGLLLPEWVDANKYRYYSYRQLETVSVISALQELGMSLKEIKLYLDKRTPDTLFKLFTRQREQVNQKILKLQNIQRMIDMRLDITQQAKEIDPTRLLLEKCEEEPLFVSDEVLDPSEEAMKKTMETFYERCDQEHITYGYPLGVIISQDNLLKRDFQFPSRFFFKFSPEEYGLPKVCKPSGLYLIGFEEVAYFDSPTNTYKRMLKFMKQHHLECSGNSYEEGLLDEIAIKEPGKYLTKISIQVRKTNYKD